MQLRLNIPNQNQRLSTDHPPRTKLHRLFWWQALCRTWVDRTWVNIDGQRPQCLAAKIKLWE